MPIYSIIGVKGPGYYVLELKIRNCGFWATPGCYFVKHVGDLVLEDL